MLLAFSTSRAKTAASFLAPINAFVPHATVRLVNAVFYAHHGVLEEEHRIGGRYEVDVAITLDVSEAAETDDLSKTVDYERVYSLVREVVTGNSSYLIERVGGRIATAVGEAYPTVDLIEVTIRKPNPPVGGPCDRAEVVIRWSPSS
ncbi:dihydroneopterin aldolase [Rubrivirga sp.]|uniref:dihydroneopterin aldolase n=1 Tax=Rubrivirga sp. TaxID=1885344 RepID=UPI003C73C00F